MNILWKFQVDPIKTQGGVAAEKKGKKNNKFKNPVKQQQFGLSPKLINISALGGDRALWFALSYTDFWRAFQWCTSRLDSLFGSRVGFHFNMQMAKYGWLKVF